MDKRFSEIVMLLCSHANYSRKLVTARDYVNFGSKQYRGKKEAILLCRVFATTDLKCTLMEEEKKIIV